MLVEARRLPDDRHDAVGARELEQRVHVAVGQPVRHPAQLQLRVDLRAKPRAPGGFVSLEHARAERVAPERRREHLRCGRRAHQAVVDSAARRRLHDARGIADGDQPIAERACDGGQRQHLAARSGGRLRRHLPALPHPAEKAPERFCGVAVAHQADARKRARRPLDRHRPREPVRRDRAPEVHLDVARVVDGQLQLRRLHEHGGHPEPEPALQRVVRAARQDARAGRVRRPIAEHEPHASRLHGHAGHPLPRDDGRPGTGGPGREHAIEHEPIDRERLHGRRRVFDRAPDGEKNRTVCRGFSTASRGSVNSSNASHAMTPVQCTGSPLVACSSKSATSRPADASSWATYRPPGPPPTTATSCMSEGNRLAPRRACR